MTSGHSNRAPYAPRRGYLLPFVSLALSLPPFLIVLAACAIAIYHAMTGQTFDLVAPALQSAAVYGAIVCYIVFGPLIGLILCLTQRGLAQQVYGSDLMLGYRMKRLNTLALSVAAVAVCTLFLLITALFVGHALIGT